MVERIKELKHNCSLCNKKSAEVPLISCDLHYICLECVELLNGLKDEYVETRQSSIMIEDCTHGGWFEREEKRKETGESKEG